VLFTCSIIIASFLLSFGLMAMARLILLKHGCLDRPNDRSSHGVPVPRGGGIALLLVLVPGLIAALFFNNALEKYAGLLAGLAVLIAISWLDDRKGVHAGIRLAFHIFAAVLGSLVFSPDEKLFGTYLPLWLDRAILILGWAWFLNLYNFMDGIDGITGVETVSLATGVCLVMSVAGLNQPFVDVSTLLLTGGLLGFLAFNWYPARLFLGDVGSIPLGYIVGFLLLWLAMQGYFIPALILPLYYLADSGITLTKRALRKEKIWQAHRTHFYQRAAQVVGRHDIVVYWVLAGNIGLIAAALLAVFYPILGLALALPIVGFLLYRMNKAGG
jgi:UDP-N-acetylmuramyl pentapeptide phosphotransferase/UDP-N-acetylglucosamine-1-phosphate transferase